jgi:hypothetical protein
MKWFLVIATLLGHSALVCAQTGYVRRFPIGPGWARTQINAVSFRKNSVTSHRDFQYAAFYDGESRVVLAKRRHNSTRWAIKQTFESGGTADAHNSISIAVDGQGFLHMAWDLHNSRLRYARGSRTASLDLTAQPMIGTQEDRVTYPEFYNLPNGDLLFLYRDGASGGGNLVMNRYDVRNRRWQRLHDNLIDGEGVRNAYWQVAIDTRGGIHVSWVWRETPDVASNHDMCYAKSLDGGKTWQRSSGQRYHLPITANSAEYVWQIPQRSELINQTSMAVDKAGHPYIATYWRPADSSVPQYFVIHFDGQRWYAKQVTQRQMSFSLSGGGTRRIPIARPQIVVRSRGRNSALYLIFRDRERGSRVSLASCADLANEECQITDLTQESVGMWEPTYDSILWQQRERLHLLLQNVGQGEQETTENLAPQMVSILEWAPPRTGRRK